MFICKANGFVLCLVGSGGGGGTRLHSSFLKKKNFYLPKENIFNIFTENSNKTYYLYYILEECLYNVFVYVYVCVRMHVLKEN